MDRISLSRTVTSAEPVAAVKRKRQASGPGLRSAITMISLHHEASVIGSVTWTRTGTAAGLSPSAGRSSASPWDRTSAPAANSAASRSASAESICGMAVVDCACAAAGPRPAAASPPSAAPPARRSRRRMSEPKDVIALSIYPGEVLLRQAGHAHVDVDPRLMDMVAGPPPQG